MSHSPRIAALLVAAGTGSRLGAETPKQFLELSAKSDVLAFKVETPRGSQFVTLARPSKEKG